MPRHEFVYIQVHQQQVDAPRTRVILRALNNRLGREGVPDIDPATGIAMVGLTTEGVHGHDVVEDLLTEMCPGWRDYMSVNRPYEDPG